MADAASRLVEIYNELDKFFDQKDKAALSGHYVPFTRKVQGLAQFDHALEHYRDDLMLMADIRNILVHETDLGSDNPVVLPNEKLLERFELMRQHITQPPAALKTVAILQKDIFSVTENDRVEWAVKRMVSRGFSHAPLLADGCVSGVFSEYSVFAYLANGRSFMPDMLIGTLRDGLELAKYKPERYRFAPPETSVYEVEYMFSSTFKAGGRLAVVFITENGSKTGRLLGMITAINIAVISEVNLNVEYR